MKLCKDFCACVTLHMCCDPVAGRKKFDITAIFIPLDPQCSRNQVNAVDTLLSTLNN